MMQRLRLRVDGQDFETITTDEGTADQIVLDLQDSLTSDTVVDVPINSYGDGALQLEATLSVVGKNVTTLLVRVEPVPDPSGGAVGISR